MRASKSLSPEELAAKKAAKAAYDREYRAKNKEKIAAAKKLWGQSEVKKAYDKKWAEDNRERSREIKKAWKLRNPTADKEFYERNRETRLATQAAYRESKREALAAYTAAWVKKNPERAKEGYRNAYRNNRHKYIQRARARKTHVGKATPSWANVEVIADIYKAAAKEGKHVDHVIPLQGKTVCGLHVETNLQLLSPKDNLIKGNRYAG